MAKSKTPAKRVRQAEQKRLRNKSQKSRLNTAYKKFELSIQSNDAELLNQHFVELTSLIDKGVTKGILHRNTAARKKSAAAKRFNTVMAPVNSTVEE